MVFDSWRCRYRQFVKLRSLQKIFKTHVYYIHLVVGAHS